MNIPQTNITAYRSQYATQGRATQVPIIVINENIHNQRFIGRTFASDNDEINGCGFVETVPNRNALQVDVGGNEWFV